MSKSWTPEEIQIASKVMEQLGYMGYDEFCRRLEHSNYTAFCKDSAGNMIKIGGPFKCRADLNATLENNFSHLKIIIILSSDDIDFKKTALK